MSEAQGRAYNTRYLKIWIIFTSQYINIQSFSNSNKKVMKNDLRQYCKISNYYLMNKPLLLPLSLLKLKCFIKCI